jgi:Zn-dependent M16 (insulinase) family peptidase
MKYFLLFAFTLTMLAQQRETSYSSLSEGQVLNGFRTVAVYLDDSGRAIGSRFVHSRSGFTLDLLQIQSVPQAFIWVNTYPTSNMGEPHTQEHLLLGKGNKGRALGSSEPMELVTSSAFTDQWRTCFDFYTAAGPEVFYQHFEREMDALLHPDYTDEEVRREVRNFGVSVDPDGKLRLEEKGTVYNEMVTSMDQAGSRLFFAAGITLYGAAHPLALNSGGMPEALRILQPADIRKFHDDHYFLANMGAVISLPKEMRLPEALTRMDAALGGLEPRKIAKPVMSESQLPAPRPAQAGRIETVAYPFRSDQQPGSVLIVWPADRKLNNRDQILAGLFFDNVAGDPSTNLYKRLIDSRTREIEFGASGVNAYVDPNQGHPVYIMFQDAPVSKMNDKDLADVRARVTAELARIAAWKDGSPELAEFNARLKSRVIEQRRNLAKFINSPPRFGFRGTGPEWMMHLYRLNQEPGFRKSVTDRPELDQIENVLAGGRNIWRDSLAEWRITGVTPFVEAAKPDPALVRQEQQEREQRVAAETLRLEQRYGVADGQEAIRQYQAEYDAASAELARAEKSAAPPRFVEHPPLTLDAQLEFKETKLANGVPLVTSTFDSMTSATAGLALRLDGVPEDKLVYLSLLPELLTQVGVIENGKPVSYEQMTERLRNEILDLNASFSTNAATGRNELVVRGSGNNEAESERALGWMKLALLHPDWRPENLPRIRDLVDQSLGALRATPQAAEERWVQDPALAYRKQDSPLILATASFMTRAHNAYRLRWLLKDSGGPQTRAEISAFLAELANAGGSREERKALLASIRNGSYEGLKKLSPPARTLAAEAAQDLDLTLADIPDSSLAMDWNYLCAQMRRDLEQGPQKTLEELDSLRRSLLKTGGARMFLIASSGAQKPLAAGIGELAESLDQAALVKAAYRPGRRIDERLLGRDPSAAHPLFVGLLNANSQGGVFLNSAAATSFHDTSRDKLLDFLAANLYSGHGAHGIFMKTWAAGLAYSNGIRIGLSQGRLLYYAERTPELPQTLKFVIDELKKAQPDPALTDYAIAGAFDPARPASPYETRGEAMADDLADGLTPEVVSRFYRAILDLRQMPNLGEELFRRMNHVYAAVLPGMGMKAADVPAGVFFVIGPEKQFSAYEEYLKTVEGPQTKLFRLYPRDFWLAPSQPN